MTTTITIKDKPVNATYQNVTGLTGGAGVDAVFDVVKTNGVYTASLDSLAASAGSGYVAGDTITIAGTSLGGTAPANNLILTVATVGAAGKIATFGAVGTGRVGDGTVDVAVDVTGTAGVDTYTLNGNESVFTITKTDDGIKAVSTLASNVTFTLEDHERVVFDDTAIAFDADGVAGDVYALLAAALGESDVTAEYEGIGIYLADNGWTTTQLAEALLGTTTYKTDAGGVSTETFIKHVYKNVMGTDATLADVTALTNWMTANAYSQADVLVIASQLEDFQTDIDLVGLATTGIEYIPFTA